MVSGLVRPPGVEPGTFWSVARRSIQLSYGRTQIEMERYSTLPAGSGQGADQRVVEYLSVPWKMAAWPA